MEKLENQVGPVRQLSSTHGRMEWPKRGVYFFFEDTERRTSAPYGRRVVRVGTHALKAGSNTTIWNRLSQHRGNAKDKGGNHRGSIFRSIIGRALMERDNLSISTWGQGSSAPSDIRAAEKPMEQSVSDHIGQMRIICLDVPDEAGPDSLRGYIEKNTIALLSNYEKSAIDPPSKAWLGSYCDREKVRQSGLWNSNHVTESYDPEFLQVFENLIDQMGGQKSDTIMQKDMKIIMQCAGSKNSGGFLKAGDGRSVVFVADPSLAPKDTDCIYAHPDEMRSDGKSWRQYLVEYNALKPHNPDGLYAAIDLYRNTAYADLKDTFGVENVFILSAGWGLVRGDFLLPRYDITFSQSGKSTPYILRANNHDFMDYNMLDLTSRDALIYLGGKKYIDFFRDLTQSYAGERTLIFNAATPPKAPGCLHVKFDTTTRTNWHYECAHKICTDTSWLFDALWEKDDNSPQSQQKIKSMPEQRLAGKVDLISDKLGFATSHLAAIERQHARFLGANFTSVKRTVAASPVETEPEGIAPFPTGDFRFFALDVETANNTRGSICQIGVACVHPDNSIETWISYVDPETSDWSCTRIHGITAKTVSGAPTFDEVIPMLKTALANKMVYQHSGFDRSAIGAACEDNNLSIPNWDWHDSVQVARKAWPELKGNGGHGLASLKDYLDLQFTHHDAGEDARASAEIVLLAESK